MTTLLLGLALAAAEPCTADWPHYAAYVERFVSRDGRVIDRTDGDRTTSEGQAYGMFFALAANDRETFDSLVRWTDDNLTRGGLERSLPAWKWGRDRGGAWGILDANAASDADLWMSYALIEAGRLWGNDRYVALGRAIAAQILAREIAHLPKLGPTLLPGPAGFVLSGSRGWRLNPSYVTPQLFRRLASAGVPGPWAALGESGVRVVREAAQRGSVPDWVAYSPRRGFVTDPVHGPTGSYDAIRAYLWIGMLPAEDPVRQQLAPLLRGPLDALARSGELPEHIDVRRGTAHGHAPIGFYAALLPLARSSPGEQARVIEARLSGAVKDGLYGDPTTYYDQNLVLFGLGFAQGRFRFTADGRLSPAWEATCGTASR